MTEVVQISGFNFNTRIRMQTISEISNVYKIISGSNAGRILPGSQVVSNASPFEHCQKWSLQSPAVQFFISVHTVCQGSSDPPEKIFNIFASENEVYTVYQQLRYFRLNIIRLQSKIILGQMNSIG